MSWWKWSSEDLEKQADEVVERVMAEQRSKEINPHYTIGPDDTNGVCLRLGNGYSSAMLSMTPKATVDMIRQLAAMIHDHYEITIRAQDPEEK